MTAEEQATFDAISARANTAETALAIGNAVNTQAWINANDAREEITRRATRNEKGELVFRSDKIGDDKSPTFTDAAGIAAEVAAARPHWIRAQITAGTGAQGASAGNPPATSNITYAELLKPTNAAKMREYVTQKPEALARLRDAHFTRN